MGRRMLLENPSTYVEFQASTIESSTSCAPSSKRTGCGLLLDVNNVFVSAKNHNRDPSDYIDDSRSRMWARSTWPAMHADRCEGRAAADRRAWLAGRRRRMGPLREGADARRSQADPDRMGQRRAGFPRALRRSETRRRALLHEAIEAQPPHAGPPWRRADLAAFAAALLDPARRCRMRSPPGTMRRSRVSPSIATTSPLGWWKRCAKRFPVASGWWEKSSSPPWRESSCAVRRRVRRCFISMATRWRISLALFRRLPPCLISPTWRASNTPTASLITRPMRRR